MGSFFKTFFASLLALVVFTLLVVFFLLASLGRIASSEKPQVLAKSVRDRLLGALEGVR